MYFGNDKVPKATRRDGISRFTHGPSEQKLLSRKDQNQNGLPEQTGETELLFEVIDLASRSPVAAMGSA